MLLYKTKITKIGEQAYDITKIGIAIIFNETAPNELAQISFLHTIEELRGKIREKDILKIDDKIFNILDIGYEVNKNLELLGHCTLKFENETELLPGDMRIEGTMPDIKIGTTIEIYREDEN